VWAGPADSLLDLARTRVGFREWARRVEAESQIGNRSVVRTHEADLARLQARDVVDDAQDNVPLDGVLDHRSPFRLLGERFDVCLHVVDLGPGLSDRRLDLICDLVSLLQRQLPGKLQMQRHLRSPADVEDADVVYLAHAWHAERGRMGAVANRSLVFLRLDVDDHVAAG